MFNFHVRVHWTATEDYGSNQLAASPEEALKQARYAIACKANVTEDFLDLNAHFTVRFFPLPP